MSRYAFMRAFAEWMSRVTHAMLSATATVEDSITQGIAKVENAVIDVEGRIHDKALSAAHALANKEHAAIQKAHDDALRAVTRARAAYGRIVGTMDKDIETVWAKLDDAVERHS